MDIDAEWKSIDMNWPYIGLVLHHSSFQMVLVVERAIVCIVPNALEATKGLFGAFYTFDVCYPKQLKIFFLFVESNNNYFLSPAKQLCSMHPKIRTAMPEVPISALNWSCCR